MDISNFELKRWVVFHSEAFREFCQVEVTFGKQINKNSLIT